MSVRLPQSLGVSEGVLYNWKSKAKKATLTKPQNEDKAEIELLKKKLAEAEMERDILKKALAFSAEIGKRKI